MLYAFQLYLIVCALFLAGKDADSYLLMQHTSTPLIAARVKRWHRDGAILYLLIIVPLLTWQPILAWKTCVAALLIRLTLFDLAFNHWANLSAQYLGGTAWADRLFVRIFGQQGAVTKAVTFFIIWVALNLLNQFL
jgi:hypothetical protein